LIVKVIFLWDLKFHATFIMKSLKKIDETEEFDIRKTNLVEIHLVSLGLNKSSASSWSQKKIEIQKEFCLKKVFALGNIELVRVDGSYSVQMKVHGSFQWYQQKTGPNFIQFFQQDGNTFWKSKKFIT